MLTSLPSAVAHAPSVPGDPVAYAAGMSDTRDNDDNPERVFSDLEKVVDETAPDDDDHEASE